MTGEIRDLARIDAGRGEHVALEDLLPTLGKVDSNATCLTDVCGNNGGVQNRIRATRRGNVTTIRSGNLPTCHAVEHTTIRTGPDPILMYI